MKMQKTKRSEWAVTIAIAMGLALAGTFHAASGAGADIADAAKNRNAAAVRTIIAQHGNVNAAQPDGTTALHWAAHWNDAESVAMLLKAGANANVKNRYGATPLSEAVVAGNAATVQALLAAGADPKTLTTEDGETVLMTAARSGNADVVRLLLDRGADVNAKENYKGQTALMWAASERHPAVMKLLLDHGADWKARSADRETRMPRLSAASSISPISRGGLTAFSFVAREGDIEEARVLLDAGADINYGDVDNTTPLVVSIINKQYTLARFLMEHGANPNIADASGRAALYAIVNARNEDWSDLPSRVSEDPLPSLDILKELLALKAEPNAVLTKSFPGRNGMDTGDNTLGPGTTPMMRAARSGDVEALRLLLKNGADIKLATRDGNTATLFAAGVGYRDKYTIGTESAALETLKACLDAGGDPNQANSKGEMLLHGAATRGADSIVQFLVDHGAAINAKTRQGYTPLDVALGKGSIGLPTPKDSTVALIKKLGGLEGKDIK